MVAPKVPVRRTDLLVRASGADGQVIIKDPRQGRYFQLGQEEHFLWERFDGTTKTEAIQEAFKARFGRDLTTDELADFIKIAANKGIIELLPNDSSDPSDSTGPQPTPSKEPPQARARRFNLLYWRKNFFNPDRLMTWLIPYLGFCWTKTFFAISASMIAAAVGFAFSNSHEIGQQLSNRVSGVSFVLAWITLLGITTIHEFGHGLTCKRHGGEVPEVGFLLMYFMPCFYCNVSDAWLISDKQKRLWVTAAGGYVEGFIWAIAVFVWRFTVEDVFINYLALTVITVSGFRIFFNCNPFFKLDGYYLLSDWLEMPNLRQEALGYVMGHVRWLLWGAPKPEKAARGHILVAYGVACWTFSVFATFTMLTIIGQALFERIGGIGIALVAILALVAIRGLSSGLTKGEFAKMLTTRRRRVAVILLIIAGAGTALCVVPLEKRASGTFEVCPLKRYEVRTPIAGFLREVNFDEGDQVSPGAILARLEVPDLESRITRKEAEVAEVEASLHLIRQGTRPEELDEQKQRIARAEEWRDMAKDNLVRAEEGVGDELSRLEQKVRQFQAEVASAKLTLARTKEIFRKNAISAQQYQEEGKKVEVATALLEQAIAEKATREKLGTLEAEQELAKREKELSDEKGAMKLLQAGSRVELIQAEEAKLARLQEELKYHHELKAQLPVTCDEPGVVVTPRLKEKVGQYLSEGDLICVVEELSSLLIEIKLPEEEIRDVVEGQRVELKARAIPFETFESKVDRIAPSAQEGDVQSSIVVYTYLDRPDSELRPGMTGYARISCGAQPVGRILLNKGLRYVRTEFWW